MEEVKLYAITLNASADLTCGFGVGMALYSFFSLRKQGQVFIPLSISRWMLATLGQGHGSGEIALFSWGNFQRGLVAKDCLPGTPNNWNNKHFIERGSRNTSFTTVQTLRALTPLLWWAQDHISYSYMSIKLTL